MKLKTNKPFKRKSFLFFLKKKLLTLEIILKHEDFMCEVRFKK